MNEIPYSKIDIKRENSFIQDSIQDHGSFSWFYSDDSWLYCVFVSYVYTHTHTHTHTHIHTYPKKS